MPKCEHCQKELKVGQEVWLELSKTDMMYYHSLPIDHESQGAFPFGKSCAKKSDMVADRKIKKPC